MAFPPVVPPGWSPSSFFTGAPCSHSLYLSFVWGCVPGCGAFLFPTTFLPCHVLSGGSLSVASLRQFMTLFPAVMLSISIDCGSFWCTLTVFCLDPHLSFVSSSLSGLLLLCRVSLVFFPGSLGPSVCPYTWVFLPLVPPRFTLLVGPWSSPMALLLPVSPSSTATAGHRQLLLTLFAFPSSCGVPVLCTVRSFCFGVVSPCLPDFLLLGFLLFHSLGYLGTELPGLLSVSLRFCILPVVHVFLIHGFRLPLRFSFGLFLPRLRCYALRFLFCLLFSFRFPSGRFGVCLPWLLSPPFPCDTLFFLCVCGLGWLAWLFHALHLLSLVSVPLSFLLVRHFPSFFRHSSDSVASPFPSATGSPFGLSQFFFRLLHSSFAGLRTPSDLSVCLHPPTSLPLLLQSVVYYG